MQECTRQNVLLYFCAENDGAEKMKNYSGNSTLGLLLLRGQGLSLCQKYVTRDEQTYDERHLKR